MAEDRRPRAVVVGTGFGVITHLRAMRAAGLDVVALVGRDGAKAAERAARFEVPHASTSLAEALAQPGVEVVAVTTPPHTHAAITREALEARTHVVCEKPFARDRDEAAALLAAAEAAGVVHLLGTEFRFAPAQAQLARTIAAGAIGTPRHGLFELQLPTLRDPAAALPDWWERESEGGGWLGAYGSHVLDQVRTLFGEVVGVSASLQRLSPRPAMTADDTYSLHLRTRAADGDEAVVLAYSSCAAGGPMAAATKVLGADGAAWLHGDEVWIDDGSGPRVVPTDPDLVLGPPEPPPPELVRTSYDQWHATGLELPPYRRLYEVLVARVLGRAGPERPAAATFADGLAAQEVLDAARASSAAAGAWIATQRS